ncbi:hypothetical protein VTJ04DRAFT_10705 [Mycothermus thermophilus]
MFVTLLLSCIGFHECCDSKTSSHGFGWMGVFRDGADGVVCGTARGGIRHLAATGPFPGKKRIENAANALLARRGRRPASHRWYKRWKKTHEEDLREIITSVSAGGAVEGSGPESAERFEDINDFLDKVYLVDAGVRDGEGDANGSVDGLDELTDDVSQTGEGVANAPNPGAEGFITGSDGNFEHIRPYPPESTGSRPLSPS